MNFLEDLNRYKYLSYLFQLLSFAPLVGFAQVAVTNDGSRPHQSAQLEVKSANKGLLLPRVANPSSSLNNQAEGLVLYNTTSQQPNFFNGSSWQTMGGALLSRFPRSIGFQGVSGINSNYNWVAPAGVTEIWVEMWGGGDAGSRTDNTINNDELSGVPGGDAGDYASILFTVTPGQSYSIVVGGGGASTV